MSVSKDEPLWRPANPQDTRLARFRAHISQKFRLELGASYEELYEWSINAETYDVFWQEVADWAETGIIYSRRWTTIVDKNATIASNPTWFEGARLNWAQNMLRIRSPTKTALIDFTEPKDSGSPEYRRMSYAELYEAVRRAATALKELGVEPLTRVGWYGPNCSECVVSCLATTSIGAIWSSTAADFAPEGVLNRFVQIKPKVLISANAVRYNGKVHSHIEKLRAVVEGLHQPELTVVLVDYVPHERREAIDANWLSWADFLQSGRHAPAELEFHQAPFDHPLWILFSSGTTGQPKPIVHRAGGMLLQSRKEHLLHGDMSSDDVFLYYTTPGWMMFNYQISALSFGCTLALFDGSPLYDPSLLWRVADDLDVTVFGTSAKYIEVLAKSYSPREHHKLSTLKQILSTGSPLSPDLFRWTYKNVKDDLLLGSITGGTDICSLFAGLNASLPVYTGELQCRCLGMAVEIWGEDAQPVARDEAGELVCIRPFPCMPIFFWGDDDGSRYKSSYFEHFPGVWHHGDFCMLTATREGNGGGLVMLGRSDGVLNPSGVRFGSGELTSVVENLPIHMDSPIDDSLAIGLKTLNEDEKVVLFLKIKPGRQLEPDFINLLKREIRNRRSARHVPAEVIAVEDVPYTINNKKVEVPVKKIINGQPTKINQATLRNPECLPEYERIGQRLRAALR